MDICRLFADRLAADFGIHVNPQDLIADGKLRRITPDGDKRKSNALAYRIHDDDSPVGWFQYHKTGEKGSFRLGDAPRLSPAEREAERRRWADQKARQEAEEAARHDARADLAVRLWTNGKPPTGHPYLERKGIESAPTVRACTLAMGDFLSDPERTDVEPDALLVPLYSAPGVIRSIQAILADGFKLFLAGGQIAGCYHPIKGTDTSRVLVCEGYATGVALAEATGHSVVCAMSAKNLPAVARIVAQQAKGREVVICADNDHGTQAKRGRNPGRDAGRDAANAIGARVVWPTGCEGTDWDDWLREGGDPAHLRTLVAGEVPPPPDEGESEARGTPERDGTAAGVAESDSLPEPSQGAAIEGEVLDNRSGSTYGAIVSWSSLGLETSDKGVPHTNLDNGVRIIQQHPELAGRIWLDEFAGRIHTDWPHGDVREWTDAMDNQLNLFMQRILKLHKMGITVVQQSVNTAAYANRRNELTEWLGALEWDGVPRLETFMATAFGTQQDAYSAAVGRCWLISMVARAFDPGCKVDTMPVFEGGQGITKSTALHVLGGKWYAENNTDVTSKDFIENIQGIWLVEIAEMHAFGKAEVERIKSIITCRNDRYRAAYARRSEDHMRRCVFAGTTNRDDWNRDETGARRFWPVACKSVDLQWIKESRDQLFAEAVKLYKAGTPWWDIPVDMAKDEQDKRRQGDVWDEPVADYVDGRFWVTTGQVLEQALRVPIERQDYQSQRRVGSILRALGWMPKVRKSAGRCERGWLPPDSDEM
jgi:predicted P-loop ATPase/phage/plasmid primase-like uncharacterized protein